MKLTKHIFRWHHWCGLIVGLFLLLMSITGSMLAFSEEMESYEERYIPAVSAKRGNANFDASFFKISNTFPDWEIRLYHLPVQGKTLIYELRKKEKSRKIYVDPVTGEIIGENKNANRSFQRQLLLLHYTLFAGTAGKIVVFVIGTLFLITLLTGTIVYRKSLVKVFAFRIRFNNKSPRAFYSSLHRIVGVWSLIFNLLIVVTGLWLSGQIALTAIKSTGAKSVQAIQKKIVSIDAAIARIRSEYPAFEIHLVRVRPASTTIQVSGRLSDDPSYYGNYYSGFTIDGSSSEILTSKFMKALPAGTRLSSMAGPLHFGNYGGTGLKIIYALLGLTPALLSISGFVLWRKRKSRRNG